MIPATQKDADAQSRFALVYAQTGDVRDASRAAGISPRRGRTWLTDMDMVSWIEQHRQHMATKLAITKLDVLRHTADVLMFDVREVFDEYGEVIHPNEWPGHIARTVAGLDVIRITRTDKDGTVEQETKFKIKIADRNSAAERLFKHFGLYEADNEQRRDGLTDLIEQIRGAGSRLPIGDAAATAALAATGGVELAIDGADML